MRPKGPLEETTRPIPGDSPPEGDVWLDTEREALGLPRKMMMELGKSMESMAKRVSAQVSKRLDKIDLESVLATVGLQVFKQRRSIAWPLVSAFGAGALVGVMFAPMSGKELRGRIADLARRATEGVRELTLDGKPVASPIEDATRERDERVNATPRTARRVQALPGETGPHLSSPT